MTDQLKQNEFKELTTTLYFLKGLSEELSQEKDAIMSSVGQISFASKQFKNYSDKFEEKIEHLNRDIPAIISQEIKNTGKLIAEEASRSFIDSATTQTEHSIKRLLETIQRCQDQVEKASKRTNFISRWFIASCIATAIFGGLIGGAVIHYAFPKMDQEMVNQLTYGATFKDIWSKLTDKEREKLKAIHNMGFFAQRRENFDDLAETRTTPCFSGKN